MSIRIIHGQTLGGRGKIQFNIGGDEYDGPSPDGETLLLKVEPVGKLKGIVDTQGVSRGRLYRIIDQDRRDVQDDESSGCLSSELLQDGRHIPRRNRPPATSAGDRRGDLDEGQADNENVMNCGRIGDCLNPRGIRSLERSV